MPGAVPAQSSNVNRQYRSVITMLGFLQSQASQYVFYCTPTSRRLSYATIVCQHSCPKKPTAPVFRP